MLFSFKNTCQKLVMTSAFGMKNNFSSTTFVVLLNHNLIYNYQSKKGCNPLCLAFESNERHNDNTNLKMEKYNSFFVVAATKYLQSGFR